MHNDSNGPAAFASDAGLSRANGVAYGALGFPLAFASLPLYVALPHYYATEMGVPLATLGLLLLITRLLDALVDPWLGQWIDRVLSSSTNCVWPVGVVAACALALGMTALWWPPAAVRLSANGLLVWLAVALMVTYLGFSLLTIGHQAWGARWGGNPQQRAQLVAYREGAALLGVLVASALPVLAGLWPSHLTMAVTLVLALLLLWRIRHLRAQGGSADAKAFTSTQTVLPPTPWRTPAFRALLLVFVVNGIASAIPATLLLFFVRDRLDALAWQPWYLGGYFLAAALALPLWVRAVRRWGLTNTWLLGMALTVLAFVGVPGLRAGDQWAFLLICLASGAALGADLVVPSALLTGVIARAGATGQGEGQFFGWWAFATKLNLALAAGIALPLLGWLGYQSGATSEPALQALALGYGGLPCLLKVLAALTLAAVRRRYALA
jgi:glycoside/pentoside/hexuronide:cation symporter, GPH family